MRHPKKYISEVNWGMAWPEHFSLPSMKWMDTKSCYIWKWQVVWKIYHTVLEIWMHKNDHKGHCNDTNILDNFGSWAILLSRCLLSNLKQEHSISCMEKKHCKLRELQILYNKNQIWLLFKWALYKLFYKSSYMPMWLILVLHLDTESNGLSAWEQMRLSSIIYKTIYIEQLLWVGLCFHKWMRDEKNTNNKSEVI